MALKQIDKSGLAEGFMLIKTVEKKTTAKGMTYLDLFISDKDTEINAKLWDYNAELHGCYSNGDIIKVRGLVSQYNGSDQLRVEKIRHTVQSDEFDINELIASSEFNGLDMYNCVIDMAKSFSNSEISKLVIYIYEKYKENLLFWPAAFKLHHAMRGGLLYHTLSILRLCQGVIAIYPSVNADLLLAGAMLHDIAKIDEFVVTESGTVSGYSVEGNLIGHLAKGAIIIDRCANEIGTDKEVSMLLQHMVLSHHGQPEFGAAVRPLFIEAEILSQLDHLDANIFEMTNEVSKTTSGEFTNKMWALDNRKLYNHGKVEVSTKAKIL